MLKGRSTRLHGAAAAVVKEGAALRRGGRVAPRRERLSSPPGVQRPLAQRAVLARTHQPQPPACAGLRRPGPAAEGGRGALLLEGAEGLEGGAAVAPRRRQQPVQTVEDQEPRPSPRQGRQPRAGSIVAVPRGVGRQQVDRSLGRAGARVPGKGRRARPAAEQRQARAGAPGRHTQHPSQHLILAGAAAWASNQGDMETGVSPAKGRQLRAAGDSAPAPAPLTRAGHAPDGRPLAGLMHSRPREAPRPRVNAIHRHRAVQGCHCKAPAPGVGGEEAVRVAAGRRRGEAHPVHHLEPAGPLQAEGAAGASIQVQGLDC